MTDIYINQRKSRKGCLVVAILLVAAVLATVYAWLRPKEPRAERERPAEETATSTRKAQPDATPRAPADDPGATLLHEASTLQQADNLLEAREKCLAILDQSRNAPVRAAAEEMLGDINIKLVTTPRRMPEKEDYTIQRGDTIAVLARRYNTTVELIQKSNNLSGPLIRVGDRMRIFNGTFTVEISKTRNDLILHMNDRFFKRYRVGTGEFQRTPVGTFKITDRIAQPTWWRPDGKAIPYGSTNNVLGTHWLSLDIPGYGLHGTWEPETIGYQMSAGCVRLLNDDIEELFTLLPVGVQVTIHE